MIMIEENFMCLGPDRIEIQLPNYLAEGILYDPYRCRRICRSRTASWRSRWFT